MSKNITHAFVKEQIENDDHQLLSPEYINAKTKLNYICPNGHENSMTWSNWQQGYRCPDCAGTKKLTHEFVKQDIEKLSYIFLSKDYNNSSSKFDYICPNGHENNMSWGHWQQGHRCPNCVGNKKLTNEFVKQYFEERSCILTSKEYTNNSTKLKYICPNGHQNSKSWKHWQQVQTCPKCSDWGTSNFEKEVKDFVIGQGIEIIENDRTLIKNPENNYPMELDILFPCKTKAIECNGIYWHSMPDAIVRDEIKNKQCKEKEIELLIIIDIEWTSNKEKQKLIIKEFIGD